MATKALIKPELLVWTRNRAKVTVADAAKAANIAAGDIEAWEAGSDAPSLNQLRCLAAKYHFPLAVFYLPEPPADFTPLRDFRRLPDSGDPSITANLAFHIRAAYERRELALELHDDLREKPRVFPLKAKLGDDPEALGMAIRAFLSVDDEAQKKAARANRAFDFWRRKLEESDVMVFVISGPHYSVELDEMRGFAIAKETLPVVVVNGKDYSQGGKCYTLLHELTHIILGESAISNGNSGNPGTSVEEQRIERFCDAVAAAALMPRGLVLSFPKVAAPGERKWSGDDLRIIAHNIGVSREALLLRFITLKRATWDFYNSQRARFKDEYEQAAAEKALGEKKAIKIKRSIMLMSWNGRGYTRLVLRSYYDQRITLNDVSSYLGAKVKHIPALERAAFQRVDAQHLMTYCIDTSSLIAAWQERYPIENFPAFWVKMDTLIVAGRLIAPVDVLHETKKRSDELHTWLKARRAMFRELDDAVQIEAAQVLAQFPRLVGEKKMRTSADPFVIALARVEGLQLVTDEKPTGSMSRPNIPDVCAELNMTAINVLDLIRAEKWVVGQILPVAKVKAGPYCFTATTAPVQMFPTLDLVCSARLMAMMDSINGRFGRGMMRPAGSDVERLWSAKAEHLSPRYTTRMAEILTVHA